MLVHTLLVSALSFRASDPTNHGSNVGAVALFALGIFALIGLLAYLITRRGRRPPRPAAPAGPVPGPRQEGGPESDPAQNTASDANAR